MATGVQVVFDCADPDRQARFWAEALHYELEKPPQGFTSWEAWARAEGIPEEHWNDASAIVDPEGNARASSSRRSPRGRSRRTACTST